MLNNALGFAICIIALGFFRWHTKIQPLQDELIRKQLDKVELEIKVIRKQLNQVPYRQRNR